MAICVVVSKRVINGPRMPHLFSLRPVRSTAARLKQKRDASLRWHDGEGIVKEPFTALIPFKLISPRAHGGAARIWPYSRRGYYLNNRFSFLAAVPNCP
jgi:hypothetical protein